MKRVLITGSSGQLGRKIRDLSSSVRGMQFLFVDKGSLDVTNPQQVEEVFFRFKPHYCINCAAYTNVDRAEKEPDLAMAVNANGVLNLIHACKRLNTVLIQVSTDFVFDGKSNKPYVPKDLPHPVNAYGRSKFQAERYMAKHLEMFFIIRTSWLYSEYGDNFARTILRRVLAGKQTKVVADVFGSPTYAGDLARFLIQVIESGNMAYGVYHYCNRGKATWYDFATEIAALAGIKGIVRPITASEYPTIARRPGYTVMSTSTSEVTFQIRIPAWKESLTKEYNSIFASVNSEKYLP